MISNRRAWSAAVVVVAAAGVATAHAATHTYYYNQVTQESRWYVRRRRVRLAFVYGRSCVPLGFAQTLTALLTTHACIQGRSESLGALRRRTGP